MMGLSFYLIPYVAFMLFVLIFLSLKTLGQ
jgi:hypothetical protein